MGQVKLDVVHVHVLEDGEGLQLLLCSLVIEPVLHGSRPAVLVLTCFPAWGHPLQVGDDQPIRCHCCDGGGWHFKLRYLKF